MTGIPNRNAGGVSAKTVVLPRGIPRLNTSHPAYSRRVVFLFLLCSAYVAIPKGDIPFLGISLSAPIMFLIALEVYLRPPAPWLRQYRRWVLLATAMWAGIFISAVANGLLSGGTDMDRQGALEVFRFAYWLGVVFLVTVYLVSYLDLGRRTIQWMAGAVVLTALIRWFEAIAFGKIGAWTNPRFFTQNFYGWLFSTFTPFLYALLVDPKTKRRWMVAAGILVIWSAAAINGSRGSWVGLAGGLLFFLLLYLRVHPGHIKGVILLILVCAGFLGLITLAPERVVAAVSQRYATFQRLEEDKTYMARQLMIQKGLRLFRESPLIGVGPARWTKEYVPLVVPEILGGWRRESFYQSRLSAHNSYIPMLAETGLAGAVPYAFLLLTLIWKGYTSAVRLAKEGDLWALGVYVAFIGMSIHFWVLAGLTGTSAWVMYGLVGAAIESAKCLPAKNGA
ncbi:MAG: O-antigen ligase family protein [Anaerolineae bacterium]